MKAIITTFSGVWITILSVLAFLTAFDVFVALCGMRLIGTRWVWLLMGGVMMQQQILVGYLSLVWVILHLIISLMLFYWSSKWVASHDYHMMVT